MEGQFAVRAGFSYQPMVPLFLATGGGIVVDRYAPLGLAVSYCAAVLLLASWLCAWLTAHERLAALLLLCAAALAGALWHHDRWRVFPGDEIGLAARQESGPVCLRATVLAAPQRLLAPEVDPLRPVPVGDRTTVPLAVTHLRNGTAWQIASGRVQLSVTGHLLDVRAGDRLQVYGVFYAWRGPTNPGEFDFAAFHRTQRRLCGVHANHPDCVTVAGGRSDWRFDAGLDRVRRMGLQLLDEYVAVRHADLAGALLLGARSSLDTAQTERFLKTGTIHLLAVSGLHVGMLVCGWLWLKRSRVLSRRSALWCAIAFVLLYALLTGSRPPVVRAAVLVSVMCFASLYGRRAFGFNTLALAGIIVLIVNPTHLFQAGAQLSFLAVATLGCLGPLGERLQAPRDPLDLLIAGSQPWLVRAGIRVGRALAGPWLSSAGVWLVTAPLVMYRFHVVSPLAIMLNPLVLPPLFGALFSGFGVFVFGWLIPPLARVCGAICSGCLSVLSWQIETALAIPHSHLWLPAPPSWWVVGFYLALAACTLCRSLQLPCRWAIAAICVWFAIGLYQATGMRATESAELRCTFVDVGHGTSVILELPDGQTILYDAGQLGSPATAARRITGALWASGHSHLDALVVSHADLDHFNAIPALLDRFSVGVAYVSPEMLRDRSLPTRVLYESLSQHHVPIRPLVRGDRLRTSGNVAINVMHPPWRGVHGSDNANSIVLRITFAGRTLLLPGDLEDEGLRMLLNQPAFDCSVAMAPHHGSPRSQPRRFAAWSSPRWVVISSGHRHQDAVEGAYGQCGAEVLNTAQCGAIRVTLKASQLTVRSWLRDRWP